MRAVIRKSVPKGPTLFDPDDTTSVTTPGGVQSIASAFKALYYHLYTNSQTSRAERIVSDLSLLLLVKLANEVKGGGQLFKAFLGGKDSQSTLIPLLRGAYPDLTDAQDKFGMGEVALRESFHILRDVQLSESPAHVLGDAFQSLIGPRLRGDKGQFFTPRSLVRAMVAEVDPKPTESVFDPACGTGGFLAEAHVYQAARAADAKVTGRLVGCDKDHDLYRLASSLLQVISDDRSVIRNGNSLEAAMAPDNLFDVVLSNPPFGSKIGVKDKEILQNYDLAHSWNESGDGHWKKTNFVGTTQDPQILFLELCVRSLKPGGRLGIVLPEGVFGNKRSAYIWDWLRSKGKILSLLDCPRTTFQPSTDIKTNVLFFVRGEQDVKVNGKLESVRVSVALHCGHDRRGRTHYQDGTPFPDDFAALSWRKVKLRHRDYLVPRYYLDRELSREEEAMVAGAEVVTLGELKDRKALTIRKGHEVGSDAYGTGDVPFVRTSDVNNFEISVDPTKAVSEAVYEEYAPQQKLKAGDLLMVVDGRYRIGATAMLTESNYRCVVQSHFRIISVTNSSLVDPYALLFALTLPSVKLRIRDLVFVQSTLGTLGNRLLELKVPLLHGKGPWSDRVSAFRDLLRKRDESLALLRKMTGPEPEL